jgi:hypothetical protein
MLDVRRSLSPFPVQTRKQRLYWQLRRPPLAGATPGFFADIAAFFHAFASIEKTFPTIGETPRSSSPAQETFYDR